MLFILSALLISCGTIKKGFVNPKKNSTDEFLVEKKSPLVMPPDYNELPVPKSNKKQESLNDNKIKELLIDTDSDKKETSNNDKNQNFEESLLKKIKKN
tara:strand:+ start:439 stop:735 length:297 start_codon:yes stop_codon:yes gene_type:complete